MSRQKRKAPDLLSEVLAGSDAEQEHKERLKKYSGAKKHSNQVADHIVAHEPTLYKEAELLRACSTWLIFRHYYTANQYKMIGGCTCKKHLLCAMCALRRSAKTVKEYEARVTQVMAEKTDLVPVLVTLTVKNGPDLAERTKHLDSAVSRMIKNRSNSLAGGRHQTCFSVIDGGAGAFEFKRGKNSGLWHPHLHMIGLVPSETDLLQLEWDMSEEWRKLTKDSQNVDVRPMYTSLEEGYFKAICEVFRYALKFGEMQIEDQVHAYKILRGKRLVRAFGSLYGVVVPDDLNDSIEDELKLKPYIDLVYEYSKGKGYFLKEVTDTGDQLTGSARPKSTEGTKAGKRLSKKLFLPVKKVGSYRKAQPLDSEYMKEWGKTASVEETYKPMEVPF